MDISKNPKFPEKIRKIIKMFTIRGNLVDAKRPRLLPDRHAAKRSEYDRDDLAMIRDMDRELGPEPFEREPGDPDYVPDESALSEFMRQ